MGSIKTIVSFLLLLGYCQVCISTEDGCSTKQVEACSSSLVKSEGIANTLFCSTMLPAAESCFKMLKASCTFEGKDEEAMNMAMKELQETKDGCEETAKENSCTEVAFQTCKMMGVAVELNCNTARSVKLCLEGVLSNCNDENMKANASEMLESLKKNMTGLKCCDYAKYTKCTADPPMMKNATDLNQKTCQKLATVNKCLEGLSDCSKKDDMWTAIVETVNGTKTSVKNCIEQGYKVTVDDSGVNLQPTLLMLIPAILVELLFIFY